MNSAAITVAKMPDVWREADWQRLWLSIWSKKRQWSSLALIPAGPGTAPEVLVRIAVALARTGTLHVKTPIHVADATRITLAELEPFSEEVAWYTGNKEMTILALPALNENVTALPLAKGADCSLLCVALGDMKVADAKQTVAQIGVSNFIGSAIFRLSAG